jgi:pyruvate/2-oxoglutarate/acetoin dehydrogenase E1 component
VVALGEDLGRGGVFGQYKRPACDEFGAGAHRSTPRSPRRPSWARPSAWRWPGCRPVVEMRLADFALCAMDEIVNQAAKNRYMFGGQGRVPLVVRLPIGMWRSVGGAAFAVASRPGLRTCPASSWSCPRTPQDNFGLLRAALPLATTR